MKKEFIFSMILMISGCSLSKVDIRIDKIKPNEIGVSSEFEGKIYNIECSGNGFTNSSEVKDVCLKNIATKLSTNTNCCREYI